MAINLDSSPQLDTFLQQHPAAAIYFSGPDCSVCQALKPKVLALLQQQFPRIEIALVDCAQAAELAAQQTVFTVPTLVIYLDGREFLRKVRNFSLRELADELERPYALFCGE